MSHYEFTFLTENDQPLVKLLEILTSFKGKKIDEKPWGKLELAYPINKKDVAEYYTWLIEIDEAQIEGFKTKLNYDNLLMRYICLKTEEKTLKPLPSLQEAV